MNYDKEVSVILAVRNEEKYIRKCLTSLIEQSYSSDRFEIIAVDGRSEDKTMSILREFESSLPTVVIVLDNPNKTSPSGRNIGIRRSRGKYIMILSGYAYVDPSCIQILAESLNDHSDDIAGIGASFDSAEDETFFGKIIGDVQSTILGGFGSTFRHNTGYVDTTAFTLYRKEVLDSIGLHDENFEMAQDLEINWRIKKAGFKLILCPSAKVYYYRRHSSFRKLFKRMAKYGIGKANFVKKHPDSFNLTYCVPSLILLLILSLSLLNVIPNILYNLILVLVGCYTFAIIASTFFLCVKRRSIKHLVAAPVYLTEHIAFGFGFLVGLLKRTKFDAQKTSIT